MNELESLGSFLRQQRESRGLSIEQVASATKINTKTIQLLESDNFLELPAKPFIRGFLLSYCKFIGINGDEALIRFHDFIESKSKERQPRDPGSSGFALERRSSERSAFILWIVMGAFVVGGGIAVFLVKPKLKHRKPSPIELLKEKRPALILAASSTTPLSEPSDAPSVTPSPSPKPIPSGSPPIIKDPLHKGANLLPQQVKHKLVMKALEDVWIRYRSDERPVVSFILRKDKLVVIYSEKQILAEVSNPQLVSAKYNSGDYVEFSALKNFAEHGGIGGVQMSAERHDITEKLFPGLNRLPENAAPN